MKTNQIIRLIIPLVLLLGAATTFFVAVLGNQQANTSTEEIQESNTTTSSFIMYLFVEGIPGEALGDHEDWIEVLAYSHNMQTPYDAGTGLISGRVKHAPLRITKMVDKASPLLYKACAQGTPIATVTLELCMNNLNQDLFYKIELDNAKIMSTQDYGLISGDYPTETVSFTYERVRWTYTEYGADGKPKGDVPSEWIYWNEVSA